MIKYALTNNPSDCCGCRACEQICAHHTIRFEENDEGFLYPVLDAAKCVGCGLCEKVCPMTASGNAQHEEEGEAYAAQYLGKDDLQTSSSGGGFIAIAKYVLAKGGVVYGAAYQDGPIVAHERVDTLEKVEKLKGSKYVQSDTRNSYSLVKKDLRNGRLVYFTGTPCQVAGLKLFLRKDYENLLTSDLICHGTPSPRMFQNTVGHMEKKLDADFVDYSFRDKRVRGWSCSSSSSSYKLHAKGKLKHVNYSKDMEAYFKAFISGHLMRMNCYQCPFACTQRCGDITLADFWGVRKHMADFPAIHKGVSLLLVNSDKGRKVLDDLTEQFLLRSLPMRIAVETNANLRQPTPFSKEREQSYRLAFSDYHGFVEKYYAGNYFVNDLKVQAEYTIRQHPWLFSAISKIKKLLKVGSKKSHRNDNKKL